MRVFIKVVRKDIMGELNNMKGGKAAYINGIVVEIMKIEPLA